MRNINYFHKTVNISRIFDFDEVNSNLNKFGNKIEDGQLVTTYDGDIICSVEVSKVYYNFDFSNFSKNILSQITNYFTPEKYRLKADSGVQELILIGDNVSIDGESYKKMISILNSTDKSKALSMNIGLVKVDDNGNQLSCTILTNFKNKHYKSSLPDKIKSFSDNLINFDIDIDYHIKTIDDLKNKKVSIVEFSKALLHTTDGKLIKSNEVKLRSLGNRLMHYYGLRKKWSTLANLTVFGIDKVEDFEISAKTIYSAYIELFRTSDTSIVARESRRIIDTLERV